MDIQLKGSNVWQNIFYFLKDEGFDIYPPATYDGECVDKFLVLTKGISSRHQGGFSTNVDLYKVICHVPHNMYHLLESYVLDVERAMVKMEPMVLPYGEKTPSFYDELNKSHNIAITYKNYKKML